MPWLHLHFMKVQSMNYLPWDRVKEAFEVVLLFFVGGRNRQLFSDQDIICFPKETIPSKYTLLYLSIYPLKCNIEDQYLKMPSFIG